MWPEADRWRVPVNDFPPRWANACGDDEYGLWADLTVNGVIQRMRWIEPGEFLMGSSDAERRKLKDKKIREWADEGEKPHHTVEISKGFWLADTPCTQKFWISVRVINPSHFGSGEGALHRPVESVSWEVVMAFLALLSALVPEACATLPTEAEWEYACRAGSQTAYWWGNDANAALANTAGTLKQTSEVKRYPPNPWGLYDVHGNVWEWCSDARRVYRVQSETDPSGGDKGAYRVLRGGSWNFSAGRARSACRNGDDSVNSWNFAGFRLALRPPSQRGGAAGR
jgi:formylglycine-generating enzyme